MVRIIQHGSRKAHLQVEAMKILEICIKHQILIEPDWVPRGENQLADYISRISDYDDWQLDPFVFNCLDGLWGPHSVDRFANDYNAQIVRFNSRFASVGAEAIDAFTVHWGGGENNWWCPPPSLIIRVIRHAEVCKAKGTLVVPYWESAPFWPVLCPDGSCFAPFVVAVCDLPLSKHLFQRGRSGNVLFNGQMPNTPVLAMRIEF